MFVLDSLCKSYAKSSVKAVDGVSLTVENGQIFGFLGPNGAGKTTTIKILTGIMQSDAGSVVIDGVNLSKESVKAKQLLSYVPDQPDIFTRLKAHEYLNFVADVYGISSELRTERIKRYTSMMKIDTVLDSKISSFSHGMKQKLVLVASLIPDPENWILDEPMVGLDPEAAYLLKQIMKERAALGKTVFFSTHVMEVAEKLCDKIAVINKGAIIFTGTVEELRKAQDSKQSLENIFLNLIDSEVLDYNEQGK